LKKKKEKKKQGLGRRSKCKIFQVKLGQLRSKLPPFPGVTSCGYAAQHANNSDDSAGQSVDDVDGAIIAEIVVT